MILGIVFTCLFLSVFFFEFSDLKFSEIFRIWENPNFDLACTCLAVRAKASLTVNPTERRPGGPLGRRLVNFAWVQFYQFSLPESIQILAGRVRDFARETIG